MTIDKHCGRDDQLHHVPASQAEAHSLIALEQSALYAARLAIARWSNSSAQAVQSAPAPAPGRAAWYAQAQQNFQEWLGRGGFAQYDIPGVEHAVPATTPAPQAVTAPTACSPARIAPTCID